MSVLTVAEAKGHFASVAIADSALQLAIDDIESEIVDRFGPYAPGTIVERLVPAANGTLVLRKKPTSILSIVEDLAYAGTPVPTRSLDVDDYRIRGFVLERTSSGANPATGWSRWGVTVEYVPQDDTARRKMATVDVLKVELAHSGYATLRIGDYSESTSQGAAGDDLPTRRRKILRRLRPKGIVMA